MQATDTPILITLTCLMHCQSRIPTQTHQSRTEVRSLESVLTGSIPEPRTEDEDVDLLLEELNDELALAGIKPPQYKESGGHAFKDLGVPFEASLEKSAGDIEEVSKDDLAKILRETNDVLKIVSDERRAMQQQVAPREKACAISNSNQNLTSAGTRKSEEDSKADDPAYIAEIIKSVLNQKDEHAPDSINDCDDQNSETSCRSSQDSFDSHY